MSHPLLDRQIKRLRRKHPDGELDLQALLDLVGHTYTQLDEERKQKDRSLSLMSEEMMALNRATMEQHEAYVSALVEGVVDGVITVDRQHQIVKMNEAAGLMFGTGREQLVGRKFCSLFQDSNGNAVLLNQADRLDLPEDAEFCGTRADGQRFPVELSVSKIEMGGAVFFLVIFRDISQRKEAEKLLVEAKEKAEALAQSKADFLSTMSHEIRTPLNAVIGMTGLLDDTGLTTEQEEYVNTIKKGGESLLSIINDILDFSKIESRKLDLEYIFVPTIEPVEDVMDLLAGKAHDKKIDLLYDVGTLVPNMIETDLTRIRQVLVNLVGNAIKFTEQGEVVVTVTARQVGDDRHLFRYAVRDTGIGIPADRVNRLFQSFSQVDASTTRKYGGSGLGLAICKGIVEAMGGRIWVESEPGKGSEFIMEFEANSGHQDGLLLEDHLAAIRGKRVLVVDDNEVNLCILRKQLESWGMIVSTEQHSPVALRRIVEGEQTDLVITDSLMPEMSGDQLVREIRKVYSVESLPIVMFSSGGDRITAELGMMLNGSLSKPGRQDVMLKTFSRAMSKTSLQRDNQFQLSKSTIRTQFPRMKLLLVEDNSVNQQVAIRMLSKMGIKADVAGNGQEAIDIASRIRYDMILMDMMMPVMDGVTATSIIREREKDQGHRSTIVAMTANVMKEDINRCLDAGMDDFLPKPVRIEKLEEALLHWSRILQHI